MEQSPPLASKSWRMPPFSIVSEGRIVRRFVGVKKGGVRGDFHCWNMYIVPKHKFCSFWVIWAKLGIHPQKRHRVNLCSENEITFWNIWSLFGTFLTFRARVYTSSWKMFQNFGTCSKIYFIFRTIFLRWNQWFFHYVPKITLFRHIFFFVF